MQTIIKPSKLHGEIKAVPSKSYSHRAIICASLAKGTSKIANVQFSNDVLATIDCCKKMGAKIEVYEDYLVITGTEDINTSEIFDAKESGSTLRFLIPVLLLSGRDFTITGEGKLPNRPLDEYYKMFKDISFKHGDSNLPLEVSGKLTPGEYVLDGRTSSQFVTGLLLALPLLNGNSTIIVENGLESLSYVDITIDVLHSFGVDIENQGYKKFIVKGNQSYKSKDYLIEGDYSQSVFFMVANALGSDVRIGGLNPYSVQGDKVSVSIIREFGCKHAYEHGQLICEERDLKPNTFSVKNCPDLGPALSILMAFAPGNSKMTDAKRLRIKESDRLEACKSIMTKLGLVSSIKDDALEVNGGTINITNNEFDSYNDHRIVMSLAILATALNQEIVINNSEAVNKSYPDFFKDFKALGGELDERY